MAVASTAAANLGLDLYSFPPVVLSRRHHHHRHLRAGLLVAYACARRKVGASQLGRSLAIPAIASLPLAGVVLAMAGRPLFVPALLGGIAYAATMLLIGIAPRHVRRVHSARRVLIAMVSETA